MSFNDRLQRHRATPRPQYGLQMHLKLYEASLGSNALNLHSASQGEGRGMDGMVPRPLLFHRRETVHLNLTISFSAWSVSCDILNPTCPTRPTTRLLHL